MESTVSGSQSTTSGLQPTAPDSQPSKPFKGCIVTIIGLLLAVIGIVSALISTYFVSAYLGAFILTLATIGNVIVPLIQWFIDKADLNIHEWLKENDRRLENIWKKRMASRKKSSASGTTAVTGPKISQSAIRFCLIIFLLCIIIAGNIIYPDVAQTFHNMLFHGCDICVDAQTGAGISDGQYHFWQENGLDNPSHAIDAESLIYNENQRAITPAPGSHYVTMVLVTTLARDGRHIGTGYNDLQAAYVLQHEADSTDSCRFSVPGDCIRVHLLIANAGDNLEYAPTVAEQIIQLETNNTHFIGVIGFPLSTPGSIEGVRILTDHNIPVISSTASSDALTAISPYFFRVAPVDSEQGPAAAQYVRTELAKAHNALVLYASGNPYSLTLATSFTQAFISQPGNGFVSKTYDANGTNDQKTYAIHQDLTDALIKNSADTPDFIYFAGYSDDFNKLLTSLRTDSSFADYSTLPIISGDTAYDLTGYTASNYQDIFFTAFASPDEWGAFDDPCHINLNIPSFVSIFFCDYAQDFGQGRQNKHDAYGFNRTNSGVMLSYDTATALIQGYIATHRDQPSREDIRQAIQSFNTCHPLPGVSGQIAFGPDGNALNKAIVILSVSSKGLTTIHNLAQGQLLVKESARC